MAQGTNDSLTHTYVCQSSLCPGDLPQPPLIVQCLGEGFGFTQDVKNASQLIERHECHTQIVLLHLTVWGLWTAALRPLAGEAVWEFFERAGNYGVSLAFLALVDVPCSRRGWCAPVWPSAMRPPDRVLALHRSLRLTTC